MDVKCRMYQNLYQVWVSAVWMYILIDVKMNLLQLEWMNVNVWIDTKWNLPLIAWMNVNVGNRNNFMYCTYYYKIFWFPHNWVWYNINWPFEANQRCFVQYLQCKKHLVLHWQFSLGYQPMQDSSTSSRSFNFVN